MQVCFVMIKLMLKNNILYIFLSFADGQDYAVPDVTKSALMVTFPSTRQPSNQSQPNNLDKTPPTYDALYAAADIISSQVPNIPSLQVELDYSEFKFFLAHLSTKCSG